MKLFTLNEKGYTLVELIISITIIALLLIVVLAFITSSLAVVFQEGKDTTKLFNAQEELDKAISDETYSCPTEAPYIVTRTNTSMSISMNDGSTASISGKLISINDKSTNEVILSTFVPE